MTQRRTQEEFENLINKHPNGDFEVLGIYSDALTKIFFRCKVCNFTFLMRPSRILDGGRCAMCKKLKRLKLFDFVMARKPYTRILVVDEDEANLEFCKKALTKAGFYVLTTTKGETALKIFDKTPPDLIILNLLLSDLDGLQILIKLSSKLKKLNAITISSAREHPPEYKKLVQSTKSIGTSETLEKPFTEAQLLKKVDDVLNTNVANSK